MSGDPLASLNYERRGERDPTGARTLVLIHGIGSRWQMWEPVLDRLSAERDVIALDLPGFGLSSPLAPGQVPSPAELARAVTRFLAELEVGRPHIAGNSLGGWVALELARLNQASSVTALSPAGFANRAESIWSTTSLIASYRAARLMGSRAARLAGYGWFRRAAYWQMVAHPGAVDSAEVAESIQALVEASGFDRTLRATTARNFRLEHPLDIPVTIAWGEQDRLLLPRQAQRAAAEIPGARVVMLPGCGHIPTYDDPELVARVILEGSSGSGARG